jgi:hypothetical protein
MGEYMNSYNLVVGKLEGNRYFGRSTIRRNDNIKKSVREIAVRM